MNPDRIKAILADQDFVAIVEKVRAKLTKTVMAKGSSQETREDALATHHALDTLLSNMRAEAQNSKDNQHE